MQTKMTEETFTAILASSVHDMKNSLGMLMNTLEEMSLDFTKEDGEIFDKFTYLEYQAARVNNDLMQLLSLYRIDHDQYPFNPAEVNVYEFLEEQMLRYAEMAERKEIAIQVAADEELWWHFDQDLLSGALNNALGNAFRYAQNNLLISAEVSDGMLHLQVQDDGQGFPAEMMAQGSQAEKGINFQSGSTGLGMYFCSTVAQLHEKAGQTGHITFDNNSELGGGRFSLFLP